MLKSETGAVQAELGHCPYGFGLLQTIHDTVYLQYFSVENSSLSMNSSNGLTSLLVLVYASFISLQIFFSVAFS